MTDTLENFPSGFNLDFVDDDDDDMMLNGGDIVTQDTNFEFDQNFTIPTQASQGFYNLYMY